MDTLSNCPIHKAPFMGIKVGQKIYYLDENSKIKKSRYAGSIVAISEKPIMLRSEKGQLIPLKTKWVSRKNRKMLKQYCKVENVFKNLIQDYL